MYNNNKPNNVIHAVYATVAKCYLYAHCLLCRYNHIYIHVCMHTHTHTHIRTTIIGRNCFKINKIII